MSGFGRGGESQPAASEFNVLRLTDERLLRRREESPSLVERPWNLLYGCRPVSEGCRCCFAHERLERFHLNAGRVPEPAARHRPVVLEAALAEPARWEGRQRVVVAPHSDLFQPTVPALFIVRVISTIAAHPQHFFEITTRRPHRMHEMLGQVRLPDNLSIGVAAEDAGTYAERVPFLVEMQARWRHLVLEPLLAPVPLERVELDTGDVLWPLEGIVQQYAGIDDTGAPHWIPKSIPKRRVPKLDWVLAGGERGLRARPPHPQWVRAVRDACRRNRVPFFFRGWGDYVPTRKPDLQDPAMVIVSEDGTLRGRGAGSSINQVALAPADVHFARLPRGDEPIQFYLDGQKWQAVPDFESRFPKVSMLDVSPLARKLQQLAAGTEPSGPTTAEFIAAKAVAPPDPE